MSDHLISQALLAWEHFLSGSGFGEPARVAAQKKEVGLTKMAAQRQKVAVLLKP